MSSTVDLKPNISSAKTQSVQRTSFLESAVKGIDMFVQQKVFTGRKDLIGLVLVGTQGTSNDLDSNGQYQNITFVRDPEIPDLAFVKYLQDQIKPGKVYGDFVDALVVAMDKIIKIVGTKKFEKRIMIFTDGKSSFNDDGIDEIINKLKSLECAVSVIGDFDDPNQVQHVKTKNQRLSETLLTRLASETGGITASFRRALEMLAKFRTKQVRQTTTFRGDLEIGSIKIPVYNYTRTAEFKVPTFKKLSAVAQQAVDPGEMEVKRETTFFLQEDEETEVPKEDLTRAYKYGKDFIPWSSVDEESMKLKAHKCLSVLGFTSKKNVPRQHYMSGSVAVVPQPGDQVAAKALSAFAQAMAAKKSVAIVRYVFRENATVRLGMLQPVISSDHFYFLYNTLPFAEDLREYPFPSLNQKRHTPTQQQLNAVDELIQSLDLTMAYKDEEGNEMDALHPKLTFNPVVQRIYQCVQHRALNPNQPLPSLDPIIEKYVNPSQELFAGASSSLDKIRQEFPLQVIERKPKDEAVRLWNESDAPLLSLSNTANADVAVHLNKKVKLENENGPMSLDTISGGQITEVGSIDPISDFKAMVSSKTSDLVSTAVEQMSKRIVQLITDSFGNQLFNKAMDCLQVLRKECVKNDESAAFNNTMITLKQLTQGKRYNEFWEMIVDDKVTLITSDEAYDSTITPEEAEQFLQEDLSAQQTATASGDKDEDVDALMDMME